jgi:hypothetical protein
MPGSLVNKMNSQYSRNKLLHYNPPITGCGNMRGGGNDNNLSTARYGFISGDNNRIYSGSRPEMSSTSKPMSCKLVGGKRSRRRGKQSRKRTMRKRKRTPLKRKRQRVKKSRKRNGKKLLTKWIKQIKKFRKRSLKGGSKSQTTSHFVHQTPGSTSVGRAGMLANPTTYTVSNKCVDNYNHYKQN